MVVFGNGGTFASASDLLWGSAWLPSHSCVPLGRMIGQAAECDRDALAPMGDAGVTRAADLGVASFLPLPNHSSRHRNLVFVRTECLEDAGSEPDAKLMPYEGTDF